MPGASFSAASRPGWLWQDGAIKYCGSSPLAVPQCSRDKGTRACLTTSQAPWHKDPQAQAPADNLSRTCVSASVRRFMPHQPHVRATRSAASWHTRSSGSARDAKENVAHAARCSPSGSRCPQQEQACVSPSSLCSSVMTAAARGLHMLRIHVPKQYICYL